MTPPIDHPLNLTTQAILTWGSWSLTAVALLIAVLLGMREKTPFYLLLLLASMFGAFAEPLYDEGLMLWFYEPGIWSHFTAFGVPQPNWTHSGYAILYGSAAMIITKSIHDGAISKSSVYIFFALELAMSCMFEMFGINGGAYEYWGPHVFRLFNYPVIIGILEATQVIFFSFAAIELRRRAKHPSHLLGLFAIFPMTFYAANFGIGGPVIIALHLDAPATSTAFVMFGTLLSIGLVFVVLRMAGNVMMGQAAAGENPAG
ncbi:hypothetical protein [Sphingobium sp. CAP-1]|uniref:hypothetical protein n=1 Tax=Sphingobium sp. CAP-1 TaxID=2676077 RepID=UPI0012BB2D55|nr:hypothetical protein [Sphingobium sp. CAP-1]QGP80492.1 hypothetical protein GL174_15275 [Sphingobium sp. CAP-1]